MNFECPQGEGIYKIRSNHDNHREDRIWEFTCKKMSMTRNCHWSGNANGWDSVMNFKCPNNGVITGALSVHHNHHEDRIWRYRCCDSEGVFECKHRGDINDWDAPMHWTVPDGYVLSGLYSHHDNGREDRRWNPYICKPGERVLADIGPSPVYLLLRHFDFPVTCPEKVNKDNWIGTATGPETFGIIPYLNGFFFVIRFDTAPTATGWDMDLQFYCQKGQRRTKTKSLKKTLKTLKGLKDLRFEQHSKNSTLTLTNVTETGSMGSNNTKLEIMENEIGDGSG